MSLSTRLTTALVLLLLALPALPQSRPRSGPGTGDPYESLVPWRFLEKGSAFVNAPLVLYWLPASPQETEASPLLTSPELVQATDRCISFAVILPADAAMIEKLGQTGKLPAVVLADAKGSVLGRVEGSRGRLTAPPVEKMVRDELNRRGETMYARITEAKKRAASGDKDGAIDLYRKLWDERCLFPLAGREAQNALKGLGVIVVEPPPQFMVDPNLPVPGTTPAKPKPKPPDGH
jgi:hypothetical protein